MFSDTITGLNEERFFVRRQRGCKGLHKQRMLKLGDHRTRFPCGFKKGIFSKVNFGLCEPSGLPLCFLFLLTICLSYCFSHFSLVGGLTFL